MPKTSDIQKEIYMAKVRQIMVMRGANISGNDIAKILAQNGINISHDYAMKLRDKIIGERKKRVDRKLAALHVSDLEDTNEAIISKCWDIASDPKETTHNKLMAMSKIADLKKATLDALMDSGFFTRKLGETTTTHELNPAVTAAIKCLEMQFKERVKPVIYEEAVIHETKKDEPKPEPTNPNVRELAGGGSIDDKGPAIAMR